jgi:uncharacterized protein YceH (UPF0502 family)
MSLNRDEKDPAGEYLVTAERTYARKRDEYERQMPLLLAERDESWNSNIAHVENQNASDVSDLDRRITKLEEEMSEATEEWR